MYSKIDIKNEEILDEPYLLQVVRYIHKNPLKAKMVKKLEDYKWSSYCDYMESKSIVISREQRDF